MNYPLNNNDLVWYNNTALSQRGIITYIWGN